MLVLKISAILLGLAFALFGYFIYFRKKNHLIDGFEEDFKAGRKDEGYARRVGMVEFVVGIAVLIVGAVLILFAKRSRRPAERAAKESEREAEKP